MARKARLQYPGALYHLFNQGVDRRDLLWNDRDRFCFPDSLALGEERFHVEFHAYCLMSNHFHLLVGTPPQERKQDDQSNGNAKSLFA